MKQNQRLMRDVQFALWGTGNANKRYGGNWDDKSVNKLKSAYSRFVGFEEKVNAEVTCVEAYLATLKEKQSHFKGSKEYLGELEKGEPDYPEPD